MSRNQNGCPIKLGEGEDWSWTSLFQPQAAPTWMIGEPHMPQMYHEEKADPGGCPWGPPFPQHTISRFGESTRQLEDGYDWGMALDFGLRKLHIFWPYCAEEKGTVCSMAWDSASLPCFCSGFCRAFWDVSHHFIPVICWGKKVRKSICVFFSKETIISLMRHQLEFYIDFLSQNLWVGQKCTKLWIAKRCLQKCVSPVGLQHSHPADMFSQTGWES